MLKVSVPDDVWEEGNSVAAEVSAIEDGKVLDYITGKLVVENEKERVRQGIARALSHEYGFLVDDLERDFKVKAVRSNKRIDIAIFEPGSKHTEENLRRVVFCQPRRGGRGRNTMSDEQFEMMKATVTACENCKYGLWTNGLALFFFRVERTRSDVKLRPIGDWPPCDESMGKGDVASKAAGRCTDPEMLRAALWECCRFIQGNEGSSTDAAFWQVLYLIFAKRYDERQTSEPPRFWAGRFENNSRFIDEQFDPVGQKAIRKRIEPLFDELKKKYPTLFRSNEEITLSDKALAFVVSQLSRYDLGRTEIDANGVAFQKFVGKKQRGYRGQYFTPRAAVKLVVSMLDPKPDERVFDPACGTGGFLTATLAHLAHEFQRQMSIAPDSESTAETLLSVEERLAAFATENLFGADVDPLLVHAAQMNVVMASNTEAHLFNINSLVFPAGHRSEVAAAPSLAKLGAMDVVMTNPPFGSEISITDPNILKHFELAHIWKRTEDGSFRNTGRLQRRVSPEVLFIERCFHCLKSGGRMGIILPAGILSNPGDEYIRWWILRHTWVLASVALPIEVFIVEADVNVVTGLLVLKKKTEQELQAGDLGSATDFEVFMAVAEKVGFDRRGNTLYKRGPDGAEMLEEVEEVERIRVNGRIVERRFRCKKKIIDDDLPFIADAYREFRAENKEPGA